MVPRQNTFSIKRPRRPIFFLLEDGMYGVQIPQATPNLEVQALRIGRRQEKEGTNDPVLDRLAIKSIPAIANQIAPHISLDSFYTNFKTPVLISYNITPREASKMRDLHNVALCCLSVGIQWLCSHENESRSEIQNVLGIVN